MANQINETSQSGEQEGDASFDFDKWLKQYGLQTIKDAFVEHDMTTLNTINMNNNKNFSSLMSDIRILTNTDLIPKIIGAIQGLESLRQSESQKQEKEVMVPIYMTKKEDTILKQIRDYSKTMQDLDDEFKEFTGNYDDKKKQNNQIINQYQTKCQARLDAITKIKTENIQKLQEMIIKKDDMIRNQIISYREDVTDIKLKQQTLTEELDVVIDGIPEKLIRNKKQFSDDIGSYQEIVRKYGGNYDTDKQNERQTELKKVGDESKAYYDEKLQEIHDEKEKIKKFIKQKPVDYDEKDDIYSIQIDEELFKDIADDINNCIVVSSIYDERQGMLHNILSSLITFIHEICTVKTGKSKQIKQLKVKLNSMANEVDKLKKKIASKEGMLYVYDCVRFDI